MLKAYRPAGSVKGIVEVKPDSVTPAYVTYQSVPAGSPDSVKLAFPSVDGTLNWRYSTTEAPSTATTPEDRLTKYPGTLPTEKGALPFGIENPISEENEALAVPLRVTDQEVPAMRPFSS